jgi:hypothetical protein
MPMLIPSLLTHRRSRGLQVSCFVGIQNPQQRHLHILSWKGFVDVPTKTLHLIGVMTPAACGGLGSASDHRTRRAILHLSYNCASPFGPKLLVTHDPEQTKLVNKL